LHINRVGLRHYRASAGDRNGTLRYFGFAAANAKGGKQSQNAAQANLVFHTASPLINKTRLSVGLRIVGPVTADVEVYIGNPITGTGMCTVKPAALACLYLLQYLQHIQKSAGVITRGVKQLQSLSIRVKFLLLTEAVLD
jgi:hypothetical protein